MTNFKWIMKQKQLPITELFRSDILNQLHASYQENVFEMWITKQLRSIPSKSKQKVY